MLFFVSLVVAAPVSFSDDFEDGSGGSWRPVEGSWFESGGAFNGTQSTLAPGAMVLAEHHSLKSDVTFEVHLTGTGLGGVVYAATASGEWCALFAGDGDLYTANSDSPDLISLLDGAATGADTELLFTVDRDRMLISLDGATMFEAVTDCALTNLDGDVGVAAAPEFGQASFLDFAATAGGVDSDGDGTPDDTDCGPDDATINPDAVEVWYDGVDQDCDGADDYDQDGDGVTNETDCDDTDRFRYPGKEDIWYDGIDGDCGGNDDYDADGDGHALDDAGGDDCNDGDESVFPGSTASECDKVDRDCDGFVPVECPDTASDPGATDDSGDGGGEPDCGCSTSGGGQAVGVGVLALLAVVRRRRG